MQPRRDLCPRELIVFHVTNNGNSSSFCELDGVSRDAREDLDDVFEFVLDKVCCEEFDGVETFDKFEDAASCNLDIWRGLRS